MSGWIALGVISLFSMLNRLANLSKDEYPRAIQRKTDLGELTWEILILVAAVAMIAVEA